MLGKIFGGSKQTIPKELRQCESVRKWSPKFNEKELKKCFASKSPRYVITDSTEDKYAVYTDNLISCLGVLIVGRSVNLVVAGLSHVKPKKSGIIEVMAGNLDDNYNLSNARAYVGVGDDPDPKTFMNVKKILIEEFRIPQGRIKVMYCGAGQPYVVNQNGGGNICAKIAYDTKSKEYHFGPDN